MSIPNIKENSLDPTDTILREADDFIQANHWYLGASGAGAKTACGVNPDQESIKDKGAGPGPNDKKMAEDSEGRGSAVLKCILNNDGTVKGSGDWKSVPAASGVWRQPFAWSDESCERRSPPIWNLFNYINNKFFDNEMTLDGFPEEIGGTRALWSTKYGDDDSIPGYGTLPDVGNPPGIWTSYCTGKSGGILLENPRMIGGKTYRKAAGKMRGSAGPHRDAPVVREEDGEGYYSIVCCMNPEWHPSWEGVAHYHETLHPDKATETHWKRGYGIGYARIACPHYPGAVWLIPSTAIHTGLDLFVPNRTSYQRRLLFRVRKKTTPNYTQPKVDCPNVECDWSDIVSANGHCPKCHSHLDHLHI
jgi:hypothetical protein